MDIKEKYFTNILHMYIQLVYTYVRCLYDTSNNSVVVSLHSKKQYKT